MSRSSCAVCAAVPVPAYCAPPGCVSEPKPGVAKPVQHSPMSLVIELGTVLVIVDPASSAKETAEPSGTGDAESALLANSGVSASATAIEGARQLRDGRLRSSTMVISQTAPAWPDA